MKKADDRYNDPDNLEFARQASRQEGDGYNNHIDVKTGKVTTNPTKTRIVEICEFAQKMDYNRIGLAFCGGLVQEAAVVEEVLKSHGFEVVSAICKAGCVPKGRINVKKEH